MIGVCAEMVTCEDVWYVNKLFIVELNTKYIHFDVVLYESCLFYIQILFSTLKRHQGVKGLIKVVSNTSSQ